MGMWMMGRLADFGWGLDPYVLGSLNKNPLLIYVHIKHIRVDYV